MPIGAHLVLNVDLLQLWILDRWQTKLPSYGRTSHGGIWMQVGLRNYQNKSRLFVLHFIDDDMCTGTRITNSFVVADILAMGICMLRTVESGLL